jgi:hypothetical protein
MKYYKILTVDGNSIHEAGVKWQLPQKTSNGNWDPGPWMPKINEDGLAYLVFNKHQIINWLGESIFEVEVKDILNESWDCVEVKQVRLISKIETWNSKNARIFAACCAEHILPIFENKYSSDELPRKAIAAAMDFALGKLNYEELIEVKSQIASLFYPIKDTPEGMVTQSIFYACSTFNDKNQVFIQNKYHGKALSKLKANRSLLYGNEAYSEEWQKENPIGKLFSIIQSSILSGKISLDEIIYHGAYRSAQIARFCVEDSIKLISEEIKKIDEVIINNFQNGNNSNIKNLNNIKDDLIKSFPINEYRDILKDSINPGNDAYKREYEYQTEKFFEIILNSNN